MLDLKWTVNEDSSVHECEIPFENGLLPMFKLRCVKMGDISGFYQPCIRVFKSSGIEDVSKGHNWPMIASGPPEPTVTLARAKCLNLLKSLFDNVTYEVAKINLKAVMPLQLKK